MFDIGEINLAKQLYNTFKMRFLVFSLNREMKELKGNQIKMSMDSKKSVSHDKSIKNKAEKDR